MRVNVIVIVLLVLGWQAHWIDGALSAIACQYIKQLIVQFKESKGKHTLIVIDRIDCYIEQTVRGYVISCSLRKWVFRCGYSTISSIWCPGDT